jgi:hypothetical protein
MAAQTGRTNAKHIGVFLDNSGGTLTDISAYVNNVGTVGKNYDSTDVTAFSDGSKNITIGQPEAPLTIGGPFDTVSHAQMIAINGAATPLSLDLRFGIRHAWETGEPQFGITSSATSGYLMTGYSVDWAAQQWSATLNVFGATSPEFGTAAET